MPSHSEVIESLAAENAELRRQIAALEADVIRVTTERDIARKIWEFWRAATKSAIVPRSPHAIPVDFDTVDAGLTALAATQEGTDNHADTD